MEGGAPVQIRVVGFKGLYCNIEADISWAIQEVKRVIKDMTGITRNRQIIISGTKRLDEETLVSSLMESCSRGLTLTLVRDQDGELAGGHKAGDKVYYTGRSHVFPSGNKVVYGGQGEVVGAATLETHRDCGLQVQFPGNDSATHCLLIQLSDDEPDPLPGGHKIGDKLYYCGISHMFESGNQVVYGTRGEVEHICMMTSGVVGLEVIFPGNTSAVKCSLDQLSVDPPEQLPPGYEVDEEVTYLGPSHIFESGNRLTFGATGKVLHPTTLGPDKERGLAVQFPWNSTPTSCYLWQLKKTARDDFMKYQVAKSGG